MEHPILLAICAFLMLMVLMSWVGYRLLYKPGKFLKQLGNPVIGGYTSALTDDESQSGFVEFLHKLGTRVVPSNSNPEVRGLRVILVQAGFRTENAVPIFYGIRVITAALMLICCIMFSARLPSNAGLMIAVIGFGAILGWILPKMVLERKVKARQETIRLSLPDALDMLVVSIEAGLGLDMAMQHVARELQFAHPQLSEELSLVTLEMRAGKRRADALRNFADRTGEGEVRKLVAILVQSDRFGTSMAESLRTHSDFMRTRRRQEAEERAGKVGVKLVFPIFFFILPSMLIVSAGPGLLMVFKNLFPMMKKVGM